MEPMHFTYGDHRVEVALAPGAAAEGWERELVDAGFMLPFQHRVAYAELEPDPGPLFFIIRQTSGAACGGFAAQRRRSHALPGHTLLRVERFGEGVRSSQARAAAIGALADVSRHLPRVLRTYVGIFSEDVTVQGDIEAHLGRAGFTKNPDRRGYSRTAVVDLRPDEDAILASLHKTARSNIRAISRFPLEVRPVDTLEYVERMQGLLTEAFARTGGETEREDWPSLLRFSARYPQLSRVVGLFRSDRTGPESLLAFVHGLHHGNHAEYSAGATSRDSEIRVSQTYALVWDLLRWARQYGATFFDLGGITSPVNDGSDPLRGISAFKRYFTKEELYVGDEWVLEPSALKSSLARMVATVVHSVARS